MSRHLSPAETRAAHADERNRVRELARHENETRRLVDERWQRRIQPLMMTSDPPAEDWGEGFTD